MVTIRPTISAGSDSTTASTEANTQANTQVNTQAREFDRRCFCAQNCEGGPTDSYDYHHTERYAKTASVFAVVTDGVWTRDAVATPVTEI